VLPLRPRRASLRDTRHDPSDDFARMSLAPLPLPDEFRFRPQSLLEHSPAPRKEIPFENTNLSAWDGEDQEEDDDGSDDDDSWDFSPLPTRSPAAEGAPFPRQLHWGSGGERAFERQAPADEVGRSLSEHYELPSTPQAESLVLAAGVITAIRAELMADGRMFGGFDNLLRYHLERAIGQSEAAHPHARHPPTLEEVLATMRSELANLIAITTARLEPDFVHARDASERAFRALCDSNGLFKRTNLPGRSGQHADAFYGQLPAAAVIRGATGRYRQRGAIGFDYDFASLRILKTMAKAVDQLLSKTTAEAAAARSSARFHARR